MTAPLPCFPFQNRLSVYSLVSAVIYIFIRLMYIFLYF